MITIAVKEPNKPWMTSKVENDLKVFQEIVGGYIEFFHRSDSDICYFCNEEGKILGLEPNFNFFGDIIVGNVFAVREDYDDGNFASLTEDDIKMFNDLGFSVLL